MLTNILAKTKQEGKSWEAGSSFQQYPPKDETDRARCWQGQKEVIVEDT